MSATIVWTLDVLNLFYTNKSKYAGKNSFIWMGPTPRVNILNPEQLKEIFSKIYDFQKPNANPLIKLIATGLLNYEGEKWATHRKIINPAFHLEKLKVTLFLSIISYHFIFNNGVWSETNDKNVNENILGHEYYLFSIL